MTTFQTPLKSGYGPFTTAEEVARGVDLSGKVVIVTGGASNLGMETVRVLSSRGARVVVPARDPESASKALSHMAGVDVMAMDLLDYNSINDFAQNFRDRHARLDLLILSAGVMATPLFRDTHGHEGQFAVNHLGHFALTTAVWPLLRASSAARVVVLSSRGHQLGGLDLTDLDFKTRPYDKWLAYGQSKTANSLFAVALDARGAPHNVRAFSVHPGSILGPLARHLTDEEIDSFGAVDKSGAAIVDPLKDMKNTQQGAATTVWCAIAPELSTSGGVYCEDCDIAAIESQGRFGVRPFAIDAQMAQSLWEVSAQMTGMDIPI